MRRLQLIIVLSAIAGVLYGQQIDIKPEGKIEVDPEVRVGRLENGLTYYIRHNGKPKGLGEFFIANSVGAIQEEDNQNGLAHFLEHLAFNGLEHFPGKSMLDFLERNGVKFGSNVNAYTSRTETVYNMSKVPLGRSSFVDSVIMVLHDWSCNILCEQEEIEHERGVIREEWRLGDNARRRVFDFQTRATHHGSKFAERNVLGDWNVINNFERETLLDFYHKWYRPDHQAVIIVGDFDVDDMEGRVIRLLSDIPAVKDGPQKEYYDLPRLDEPLVDVMLDDDVNYLSVKYILRQPYFTAEQVADWSSCKYEMVRDILNKILEERLSNDLKREDCPYKSAVSVNGNLSFRRFNTMITITTKGEEELMPSLETVMLHIKRIIEHGIYQEEFERAKDASRKGLRLNRPVSDAQLASNRLVNTYVQHFCNGIPYVHPAEKHEKMIKLFDMISINDVSAAIQYMYVDVEPIVLYAMNTSRKHLYPGKDETLKIFAKVAETPVEPVQKKSFRKFVFENVSEGGSVVSEKPLEFNNAKEWKLSNGVRVVYTLVNESSYKIDLNLQAYNGLGYDIMSEDPMLVKAAASFLSRHIGVDGFTAKELSEQLVRHDIGIQMNLRRRESSVSGSASAENAEKFFQLLRMYAVRPYFEENDVKNFKERSLNGVKTEAEISQDTFSDSLAMVLYNNHPWSMPTDSATIERIDSNVLRDLYDKTFGNYCGYTFYISSILPESVVRDLVERYIATLPTAERKQCKGLAESYRYADKDVEIVRTGRSRDIPKSNVTEIFHGHIEYNSRNAMIFSYLNEILELRYTASIREEKGGAYYVGIEHQLLPYNNGTYYLKVSFQTDPKLSEELCAEVVKALEDLADTGPADEEMTKTRLYMLKRGEDRRAKRRWSVSYYNDSSAEIDRYGDYLDDLDEVLINSVKADDVRALASKILKDNYMRAVLNERAK